jgi:hypothetical protein
MQHLAAALLLHLVMQLVANNSAFAICSFQKRGILSDYAE